MPTRAASPSDSIYQSKMVNASTPTTSRIQQSTFSYSVEQSFLEILKAVTSDNATELWPEERMLVELGTIEMTMDDEESLREQSNIIFDPIPRVSGLEPSDDPLLEVCANIYLISSKRLQAAEAPPVMKKDIATDAAKVAA